ncbi:phage minor capsid protein [Spiroplasma endosymbiont of Panorpa germanica]|uniref:phage minor capsid protein n=1 Tax=Spiroplasma endosymbiont of Panorpa germanica TaxID=3066314 RepID=UPI0030CBFE3D
MNTIINQNINATKPNGSEINNLPWWIILIIIAFVLLLFMIVPWGKITKRKEVRQELLEKQKEEKIKDKQNEPYMGVYNWFGKKQSLRLSKVVYVREEEDPCALCRPWENTVIIIADEHSQAPTMKEAIAAGYHHVGCKHIDLDYFEGVTKIPEKKYSDEHKTKMFNLRLEQYRFEQLIRDLKYDISNNPDDKKVKKSQNELNEKLLDYLNFLEKNNMKRSLEREDPLVDDIKRFE